MTPDRSEFARRFEGLIQAHGENRSDAARRLRKTPGYISQLVRGLGTPSADFLDEILTAYGVFHERDEWRRICGFPPDPSLGSLIDGQDERGRLAAEALIRQVSAPPLQQIQMLSEKLPEPPLDYVPELPQDAFRAFGGLDALPPKAVQMLARIYFAVLAEEARKQGR